MLVDAKERTARQQHRAAQNANCPLRATHAVGPIEDGALRHKRIKTRRVDLLIAQRVNRVGPLIVGEDYEHAWPLLGRNSGRSRPASYRRRGLRRSVCLQRLAFDLPAMGQLKRILRWPILVFIYKIGQHALPPAVVRASQLGHNSGVLGRDIFCFARILAAIVELPSVGLVGGVDQRVATAANAAVSPRTVHSLIALPAANVRDERSLGPGGVSIF